MIYKYCLDQYFIDRISIFLKPATLLKKETLAQVFSCEFLKLSRMSTSHDTHLPPKNLNSVDFIFIFFLYRHYFFLCHLKLNRPLHFNFDI